MSSAEGSSKFLVISKGQWDEDKSPEQIQAAIDAFYKWHDVLVAQGKMISGQRLQPAKMVVSKHGVIDGPFAETKEVIGGYWHFVANSLEEAAALGAQCPTLGFGLSLEIRPIEPKTCSAYDRTTETPQSWKK